MFRLAGRCSRCLHPARSKRQTRHLSSFRFARLSLALLLARARVRALGRLPNACHAALVRQCAAAQCFPVAPGCRIRRKQGERVKKKRRTMNACSKSVLIGVAVVSVVVVVVVVVHFMAKFVDNFMNAIIRG
jgi:hypothetical protein